MSIKTFKYRIYPRKRQITLLNQAVEDSRLIYNELLALKKNAWEKEKCNITQYEAQNLITGIKKEKGIKTATQILRFAKDRLFDSYHHFYKKHNKFPRFKGKGFYSSIGLYSGQYELQGNEVFIPKIGTIHIVKHRKWEGTPKQIVIKRSSTDKWYLCVMCEGKFRKKVAKTGKQVGIDLGLETFAVMSDGNVIERERFFKQEEDCLAKAQQSLSKQKKGTLERKRKRKVVARVHERISFKRDNFVHQHSKKLLDRYDGIVLEDLSVRDLQKKNKCAINKSIQDVAWNKFATILSYKALSAGKTVVFVNPTYTSQTCSGCGYVQRLELKDRMYKCPQCELEISRDLNAARNIYRLGAASL